MPIDGYENDELIVKEYDIGQESSPQDKKLYLMHSVQQVGEFLSLAPHLPTHPMEHLSKSKFHISDMPFKIIVTID